MKYLNTLVMGIYLVGAGICHAQYHTNTITTPDDVYAFSVNDSIANNPPIELQGE